MNISNFVFIDFLLVAYSTKFKWSIWMQSISKLQNIACSHHLTATLVLYNYFLQNETSVFKLFNNSSPKATWISANSHRDKVEVTIVIFTEPEVTNCFIVKLHWWLFEKIKQNCSIWDSETSTNLAAILKTESRNCYNHRERERISRPISVRHFR